VEDRQYEALLAAAAQRLRERDLREAAELGGAAFDGSGFILETFGRSVHVDGETLLTEPPTEMWHHLSLLQYLAAADGSRPNGEWIALADVPGGGASRGASFDREIAGLIAGRLGLHIPERIRAACEELGAEYAEDARSDLCALFRFAPNYPLRLNLWYADEEFPASGKVLVNAGVSRCLGLEVAGSVAALLVRRLCDAADEGNAPGGK